MIRLRFISTIWCIPVVLGIANAMASEAVLRVAVAVNSKPMSWRDDKGELTGFNADVARKLCESIKANCRIVDLPLAEILAKLASHELDFAVSSLIDTDERKKYAQFTRPYSRGNSFWIGKGSRETTPMLRVAAVAGTVQSEYVRDNEKAHDWKFVHMSDWLSVYEALRVGQADAAIVPFGSAMNILTNRELLAAGFGAQPMNNPKLSSQARIAVSKAQGQALVDRLNLAIDSIENNGALDQINSKYLPFRVR